MFRFKSMKVKEYYKKNSKSIWKFLEKLSILLGIISFIITIFQILPDIKSTKQDVQNIQEQLDSDDAEKTLYNYFYNIEQRDFEKAFNLFTDKKKENDSLEKFSIWVDDFVAFEWLKIRELKEKSSASKKVFIAEFWYKKRWMKSVNSIWWFYLSFDGESWKIDYSNVLFEKNWKTWSCDFIIHEWC